MKPSRIYIVRHGQSEGNVDKSVYSTKPDYAVNLTEKGVGQAIEVGSKIYHDICVDADLSMWPPVYFYVSPYYRTRQTFIQMSSFFPNHLKREDPRIRESEWVGSLADYTDSSGEERDKYSHFYYRFGNGGESGSDVYNRMSSFIDSMFRDFEKPNFPDNVIIVSHGFAMRVFLMKWFHYTVEEFEMLKNPGNCQYYKLVKGENDKYSLDKEPERREKLKRIY